MNPKLTVLLLVSAVLILFPATAFAAAELAPETAVSLLFAEKEAVNPPGWVGGLLAVIALILPFAVRFWAQKK